MMTSLLQEKRVASDVLIGPSTPSSYNRKRYYLASLGLFCLLLVQLRSWSKYGYSFHTEREAACSSGPEQFVCQIDAARTKFAQFQSSQSKTVKQAMRRYKSRYGRRPPPGMEKWFEVAFRHNSKVIDNFDQIESDLKPFRRIKVGKSQWMRRLANAKTSAPGEMLGVLNIIGGKALVFGPSVGPMSSITLERILEPVAEFLPDLSILYNWYAEPRILEGDQQKKNKKGHRLGQTSSGTQSSDIVEFEDLSGNFTYSHLVKACPDELQLPKNSNTFFYDFCREARKASHSELHGFFQAPDQFHPTNQLLPILSRGKVSVFNDILAPNVCYHHKSYRSWEINDTIPFEDKSKDLYWRGTTTGIAMTSLNWAKGHRHRLVRYMSQLRATSNALRQGKTIVAPVNGTLGGNTLQALTEVSIDEAVSKALKSLAPEVWNIGFSKTTKTCPEEVCSTILHELPLFSFDKAVMSTKHQFVFDADGQSMSCRYYYLLSTNSVIFKQTLWSEWHDERLIPWLHYIPADLDLDKHELPIIMNWFINTEKGQQYAKYIAMQSRQWAEDSLRQIDITLYFYRLLLEYASLFQ